jgi:phospholipid/cholesterol/gamma-HCH transport system substrate-binding protein
MEAEGRYTLVGMLVLLVLAALAWALVWLAGAADHIAYQAYTIYFRHQSMDGLAVGSPVKMRGVKVGVVDGYRFTIGGDEAVSVTVKIDSGVPVHTSAQAYVKRNLVTGIAAVEIANRDTKSPMLTEAAKGERYPVIQEGRSEIDKVATALSRLAENGAQALDRINTVLSEDNQAAISRTLANLRELSDHLANHEQGLDATMQGIRNAADELRLAGASVTHAATRTEDSIQGIGQNTAAALKEATLTMERLQKETMLISNRIQELSETGTLELTNVSRDVRTGADALTTAGHRLSNPRAILFGPGKQQLGPGEKLP